MLINEHLTSPTIPRNLLRICLIIFEQSKRYNIFNITKEFVYSIILKFGEIYISEPKKHNIEVEDSFSRLEKKFKILDRGE